MKNYPSVAWNLRRGKQYKHLLISEPRTIKPANYQIKNIDKFISFLTWNDKFAKQYKGKAKPYIRKGALLGVHYNRNLEVDNFKTYDQKIKGLCLILRNHNRGKGRAGDIVFLREELINKLPEKNDFKKHIYCKYKWGGKHYQGSIEPSGISTHKLNIINKYLFAVCFENTYHPLWSWGYLTHRIFNCFRAKTIPIYIGCYNIEKYIPSSLFIDFRKFYRQYDKLFEYLIHFPKEKYIEMTEKAYQWEKNHKIDLKSDLDKTIKKMIKNRKKDIENRKNR